jgi:hypothetical protein
MTDPITKGDRAKAILDSETFQEAWENARLRVKEEWTNAKKADERESLWYQYNSLDAIPRELRVMRDAAAVNRKRKKR